MTIRPILYFQTFFIPIPTCYLGKMRHEPCLIVSFEEERVGRGDELPDEGDHLRDPSLGIAEEGLAHGLLGAIV